jgi:hypothetical protein
MAMETHVIFNIDDILLPWRETEVHEYSWNPTHLALNSNKPSNQK